MAKPDIDVTMGLSADDVTTKANELQKQLQEIFSKTSGKELSTSLQTLQANLYQTAQSANETAKAIQTMENTPSSKMAELIEQEKSIIANLDTANAQLKKAQADMQDFVTKRGGTTPDSLVHTKAWDDVLAELHKFKDAQAEVAEGSANFLRTVASAPEGASTAITELIEEYRLLQNTILELTREADEYLNKSLSEGDVGARTDAQNKYDEYTKTINALKQDLATIPILIDETLSEIGAVPDITAERFLGANAEISELEDKIKEVRGDLRQLRKEGNEFTPISGLKEFSGFEEGVERAKAEVDKLTAAEQENLNAQQDLVNSGKDVLAGELPEAYEKVVNKQKNYNNKISIGIRKLEEMDEKAKSLTLGDSLKRSFGGSVVDFANNIGRIPQMLENALDQFARTLPAHIQVIYSIVKAAVKTIVNFVVTEIKIFATTLANLIKTGVTKAVNIATSAVKALVKELVKLTSNAILSPIKKLGNAISNIGKQANTSAPSLKQIGRAFLQYGLGARSLYRLINKLRTALFEGFANLALVDQPFNAAMSSIISSLEYLKNAFAAAFAPIIQAVAPALSTFINMVAQAVTWVGQLIALLTGQPFKIAVPTFKDYASSTSAGAAAAKNAAKAEKERAKALKKTAKEMRTIAGFDDVEILKAPDDNDSSSGSPSSGGGGGGGGGGGLAFQTAPFSEGLLKFAEMLKKIWKTADAYDLGVLFSEKLRDLLRAFNNAVPKIEAVTTKIAKILASFLAGFFSVYETFVELGKAIGNVINIFFTTVNAFLKEFLERSGFKNLGKDIYLTIMNALNTIDWDTIYSVFALMGIGIAQVLNETLAKPDFWEAIFNALCNALRATLIRIINFSNTLQWGEIGTAIANGVISFIQNFPVSEFINAVSTFLGGLWTAFCNFVDGMEGHWEEVGSLIASLIIGLFEDFNPEEFARGVIAFLDGLWDAFMGFVETPGWDQVVDKIQKAIVTFAEEFEWEGKVDGLITFLNNAIGALVDILDRLDLPKLFDEIYTELSESEEFQELCDKIVQLFIDYLKLKIKLKVMAFTGIGDSIIRLISGGQIGSMSELAQQAAESQYDATNGAINERSGDYENLGANGIADPIADGIESKSPDIVDKASNLNDDIIKTIESGDYNGTATNNMQNYNSGIESQKNNIHNTISGIQTDTTKTLGTGDYVLIGSNNLSGYNKGMMGIRSTVQGSVKTISSDVQTTLQSGDYQSIGSGISNKYNAGIRDGRYQVIGTAEDIQRGVYDALNDGDWNNIGDNIIEGIWHGLRNGWNWLEDKVWDLAVDLYNAACRALGIHSPSKVFAEKVGEMIPAGIGVGITDNEKTATSSVETMAQSLVDSAKNIKLPPIAMGEIVPSNAVSNNDNGQTTLSSLLNVLQSLQSEMVTRDELEELLTNIVQTHMNIDFYIGDEKLARHVNSGNSLLDRRYNPVKS